MNSNPTRAGIDVSAAKLDVRAQKPSAREPQQGLFSNDAEGHRKLIHWLGKNTLVCVEATGVYHLQLCIALRKAGIAVMVINPRVARRYAEALSVRTKTDAVDAGTLLDYATRMDFVAWSEPDAKLLELRDLARRVEDLIRAAADEKKRKHSLVAAGASRIVRNDVDVNIAHLARRVKQLEDAALGLITSDSWLTEKYALLCSITGVAKRTAIRLLAELLVLDPTMTVREIVAYAGLDPREHQSGTSMNKPARISRVGNARLRTMLYLPALSLSVKDRHARHFRDRLVARGKKKKQAVVALMRKMLHAVWTILQRGVHFDSAKLFPLDAAALSEMGGSTAESPDSATAASQPKTKKSHPKGRSEAEERKLDSSQSEATAA